jgi:hypothetical protein
MKILIAYDGSSSADAAICDLRRAGLPSDAEALVICVANGHLQAAAALRPEAVAPPDSWRSKLAEA